MRRSILIYISTLCLSTAVSAQLPFQKTFGSENGNQANAVIQTDNGGYAIAGWYDVAGLFSAEFYLISTDATADTLWARTYGSMVDTSANLVNGSGNEGLNLIQTDDGGFLFVGERHVNVGGTSDVFALKIEAGGELTWSRTYGGSDNEYGVSVQETDDGGFAIGGFTESYGEGIRNMYLIKIDEFGDTLWTRTYGGASIDAANDMQKTADGGFVLLGYSFSFGNGNSDVYLVKTDADGIPLWERTYGGDLNDIGQAVLQTADGGFIICGETESFGAGKHDMYAIKVDNAGDVEWSKVYGGNQFDGARSVAKSADEGYVIAGYTRSFGAGNEDFYVIKIDDLGDTLWTRTFGGDSDDAARSVIQSDDLGFMVAGYTRSFGEGALDVYLVKTDDLGNSECGQSADETIVSDVTTFQNSVNSDIGHGGTVSTPLTLVGYTVTKQSAPCDFINRIDTKLPEQRFKIFPNPTDHYLWIETILSDVDIPISIYDTLGKQVHLSMLNAGADQIDVSTLPSGIYFLSIELDDKPVTYKFIKH